MTPLVELSAGCALLWLGTSVEPVEDGWAEHTRIELGATGPDCDRALLPLEPGVHLVQGELVIRQGDGIRRKLGDQSFAHSERSLRDEGEVLVWLPDLLEGDRATLEVERHWTRDGALHWVPTGARHADLSVRGATVEPHGRVKPGKRGFWVGEATPADVARISAPGLEADWTAPDAALLPPSVAPAVTRELTLVLPPGDPQISLHPGGGSRLRTRLGLAFEAEERDRAWLVPTGADRTGVQFAAEPSGSATFRERPDGILIEIASSQGPSRVTVVWEQADAPTHGAPVEGEALSVEVPDGKLVTEPNGDWFVAGIGTSAILPSRKHLVKALERRWRNAAIPEPGLPNELRGAEPGWDAAAAVVPALLDRAEVIDTGADPLFVRRLVKARKTGGLSATEAGVITWLYAIQARLDAEWALVRPAHDGPAGDASPAGYTALLVRVVHEGEARWLDPGCAQCGPFEVRPELTGASALGRDLRDGPEPVVGRWTAVEDPEWVRWELVGPPALELRRWLADIPVAERYPALAARMAGPGAELVEVDGIEAPGEPIRLAARGGNGVRASPVELPPGRPDGTAWVPWIGTRERIWRGAAVEPEKFKGEALGWARVVDGETITEKLVVGSRLLTAGDLAGLAAARTPDEPQDEPAAEPQGGARDADPGEDGPDPSEEHPEAGQPEADDVGGDGEQGEVDTHQGKRRERGG